MWRCSRCETDNDDSVIECNSCDWHAPNLVAFEAKLIEDKEIPTYQIKWNFTHTTKASIDNGLGEVSSVGETKFSIREKTKLIFTGENEYSKKEFSKVLLLPAPTIESFNATESTISLGKPISLSWLTKYADKIFLSDFGDVTGLTSKDVFLRKTSSLVLSVENPSGKQEKSISFVLPMPLVVDFVSDSKKVVDGDEILLSWKTSNAETLTLIGLGKDEAVKGDSKKISLTKTTTLQLRASNESGSTEKEIQVEVFAKPEIKSLRLNRTIALANDEIEISWEAINFSKLFLLIDEDVLEVSDKTSFKFEADKTKDIKLVSESIEKLKTISQTVSLKVIERVTVNYFTASSLYTIQSKPVLLSWNVSNATEIVLLPSKKKLEADGTLNVLPSTKTVYVIEARNELTTDRHEIEIDVLPLPSISNIRLVTPPKIKLPTFYESRIEYPIREKTIKRFGQKIKSYLMGKFTIKEPRSLKTTFISFNQHSEYIEINRETSLMGIVTAIKSMTESDKKIIHLKKDKAE